MTCHADRPPVGLHVGLIHEPPVTGSMPTGPGCLDELRRGPLHPPLHGDVIHSNATLGQQLLDIAVGQPVPQVSPHRDRDHLPRELEAGKHRGHAMSSHQTSLQPSAIDQRNSPLNSSPRNRRK